MKKIITVTVIIISVILLFPIPLQLKDGGTVKYQAILYNISDVHRLAPIESDGGLEEGIIIEILGLEVFNSVRTTALPDETAEDSEPVKEPDPYPSYKTEISYANIPKTNKIYQKCLNIDKLPENVRHLPVYKFETTEDLDLFKKDFADELVMDSGYDEVPSFNEVTEKYYGNFFEKNSLLLVYIDSTNSTHRFGVESIAQHDGYLCIYLEETTGAEAIDTAMSGFFLTIPLTKAYIEGSVVFDAILNHSYDLVGNTASAFREPPTLTVTTGVSEVEALKGTFSWMYTDENGEGVAIMADSSHPLVMKEHIPMLALVPTTTANTYELDVKLSFGTLPDILPPDNAAVRCWKDEAWGNADSESEDIPVNNENGDISFTLKDGSYIYEVIAEWKGLKSVSGTVRYSFYTMKVSANSTIEIEGTVKN